MKLLYILIVLVLSSELLGQEQVIKGKIINPYNEPLNEVSVSINSSKVVAKSDCKGKFEILSAINDTLIFMKKGYVLQKVNIKNYKKIDVLIEYDYPSAIRELNENTADVAMPFGGNPLYVIDGSVEWNYTHKMRDNEYALEKGDIKSMHILKGRDATDKFGKYALNGLIWIKTKCK